MSTYAQPAPDTQRLDLSGSGLIVRKGEQKREDVGRRRQTEVLEDVLTRLSNLEERIYALEQRTKAEEE
jgi:hypothetical protein